MTLYNELVQVACEAATLAALKNGTLEPYSTPAPCHSLSSDGHKSETEGLQPFQCACPFVLVDKGCELFF
jgi:hypothetical protein